MTSPVRIYIVDVAEKKRLVKATSQAAAANHVTRGLVKVTAAKPLDIAELMQSGVKVEDAQAEPAEPQV